VDAKEHTPDLTVGDRIGFCLIGDDRERNFTMVYVGTACVGYKDETGCVVTERRPVALIVQDKVAGLTDDPPERAIYLHQGDIGEATLCQVRSASNNLGEWWVVQATNTEGHQKSFYQGDSQEQAESAYEHAKDWVNIYS